MRDRVWLAPAKLNLGLRVVGRRHDGYHLLESTFVPLDLADRLRIAVEPAAELRVELRLVARVEGVPIGPANLANRAAILFLERSRIVARVSVDLDKRVPAGAGLGGGSSDAGCVLRVLALHFPDALPPGELKSLALELGADVPFFLDPRPAWVTGIGEQIRPLAGLHGLDLLVVTPAPPLTTADVFRAFDAALTPSRASRTMPPLRDDPSPNLIAALANEKADPEELGTLLANDLAPVASRLHAGIARVRAELERLGARAVAMSGSGPTMFGLFPSSEHARVASTRGHFETTDRVLVARSCGAPSESINAGSSWGVV